MTIMELHNLLLEMKLQGEIRLIRDDFNIEELFEKPLEKCPVCGCCIKKKFIEVTK